MKTKQGISGTIICAIMLSQLGSGCATTSRSVALGGALGAGVGAIAGGIADPGKDGGYRTRNVLIGTAVGGVAGMIAGAAIQGSYQDHLDAEKKEAYQQGQTSVSEQRTRTASMPSLKDPQVEARWVEPKIAGSRYVEGHYEYVIVSPARWEGQ